MPNVSKGRWQAGWRRSGWPCGASAMAVRSSPWSSGRRPSMRQDGHWRVASPTRWRHGCARWPAAREPAACRSNSGGRRCRGGGDRADRRPACQPGAGRDRSSRASSRGSASTRTSCPSPTTAEDLVGADPAHLRRAARGRLRPDDHRHRRRPWRCSRADPVRQVTGDRRHGRVDWPHGRPGASTPVLSVLADLQSIFGARLQAFVVYAPAQHADGRAWRSCSRSTWPTSTACAARAGRWQRAGAATPVVLTRREFARSLDAFPVEFGEIIDDPRDVVRRRPVRRAVSVAPADLRRACEGQTRSLLLHLREDYMEAAGDVAADRRAGRRLGAGVPRARRACWPASTGAASTAATWRPGPPSGWASIPATVSDVLHVANAARRQQRRCGAPLPGLSRRGRAPGAARRRVVSGA